ncbi:MAG: hypothetical protein V2A77_11180 [Pseudomonadota bacterium]
MTRSVFQFVLALLVVAVFTPALSSAASIADLTLVPSKLTLLPQENFDLQVWLHPGQDSSGALSLTQAEFEVVWDSPHLLPRAGASPTLGFDNAAWGGFSSAGWDGDGAAHLSALFWDMDPSSYGDDIHVDEHGLLLMTIPLTAGDIVGPAALDYYLFMEEWEYPTLTTELGWRSVYANEIHATGTMVTVEGAPTVPVPHGILLLGAGIGGLCFRARSLGRQPRNS